MNDFIHQAPTLDNYWRSIILFGRNVASYKFALAQALLDFRDRGSDLITLDELAAPFSKHVCLHIKNAPKQATSPSSKFLDACKSHNEGETTQSDLIATTARIGFNNVIDAFHMALLHKSPLARIHCVNPTPNDLCNKAGRASQMPFQRNHKYLTLGERLHWA